MKGNTEILADVLNAESPVNGVEVTPVCPAELNNTNCVNPSGTVPGVKKFVYSKEYTLNGAAPNWRFVYQGETDTSGVSAGRSISLTNVNVASQSVVTLEATLDNTQQPNSSPTYTTIATPFYCVSRSVNFNPGAVDADGDSLVYELVPALDPGGSLVQYLPGFSGSAPLDISPGTFNFSRSTGQLSFTGKNIQRSLVVYRVSEYRNGVLLGTSMREMTVVIMDCANNPPKGDITDPAGAIMVDRVTVRTCKGNHELAFNINPSDADNGNIIKMEVNGLPADSKLDISSNSTTRPKSRFVWNMPNLGVGDYTFFVTYTDDGCPIASKQTQAYTVRIAPDTISSEDRDASCRGQGHVTVRAPENWAPWSYKVFQDSKLVYNKTDITSTSWGDSMGAGKYAIQAVNYFGCTAETSAEVSFICYIVNMPTAFSPNGDGNNDILSVLGENIQSMQLRIYNRWGSVIFESNDVKNGWDGKNNGADVPMEAYAYILSGVFKNGQAFYKKGNVTLIR